MRKKRKIAKLFVITSLLLTICCIPAYAELLGGKWPKRTVTYSMNATVESMNQYKNAVYGAISKWNSACNTFSFASQAYADVNVRFAPDDWESWMKENGYYAFGFPALDRSTGLSDTEAHPTTYQYGEVIICYNEFQQLNDTKKRQILVHEFGHIIGLAHCTKWLTSSVMDKDDIFNLDGPTSYDLNDVKTLYP